MTQEDPFTAPGAPVPPPTPAGYGPPAYGPPAYGPPAYGPPSQPQPPYGMVPPAQPGYGPPPYGQPGSPPGWGYGMPVQRTNGMAIASMVLGIVWIYWIGSVLALVLGYVAKRQIRATGEAGGGMATAGIVLGWIGVGFLTLIVVLGVSGAFDGPDYTY